MRRANPPLPVLVAIGANLPGPDGATPIESCARAARALAGLDGLRVARASGWYTTPSEPLGAGAPDFVNGVVRLEGAAGDPGALLAALHGIERAAGRVRGAPNAARTLDLDLIDAWGLVRDRPDLVLPHPRAHLRRFVLVPLTEVAPDWRHPVLAATAAVLLAALEPGPIPRRIDPPG